ncbi:MAG: DUF2971 domain-containing protein [Candidatus Riflebacteria bacterium]|nr:DUF2971 domain-containing protein [Candidatus Riflebacteria bacterium]
MSASKYSTELKEFNNGSKFAEYLENEAKKHKPFHHYTNMKTLELILKNKTLKFTRGNSKSLNDWHEPQVKGDKKYWDKTYIACFSFDDNKAELEKNYDSEIMAMWELYGLPSNEAVRISLAKDKMRDLIDISNKKVKEKQNLIYLDGEKQETILAYKIEKIVLSDVFYVKGTDNDEKVSIQQNHYGVPVHFKLTNSDNLHDFLQNWFFTGYVKNYAWGYEKEVRIILTLKDKIDKEELFMEIPDEIISSFQVTLGPSFFKSELDKPSDDIILETIKRNLNKFGIDKNKVRRSLFTGQVHFKK